MSIELPGEVVDFLNLIGVNWPDIDEDQVRAFGRHVSTFAQNIDGTHQAASGTVSQMSSAYQGSSYQQLVATWARMSSSHMQELIEGCHVVAGALDVAADTIVAAKLAAIGELVGMAISFAADQAAAIATFGLAEAAEIAIVDAAKTIVNDLVQQLEQHILGEVVGKAVAPLESIVSRAVDGLVFQAASSTFGASSSVGPSFGIVPSELTGYAQKLQSHADEVAGHAQSFASAISGVSFGG